MAPDGTRTYSKLLRDDVVRGLCAPEVASFPACDDGDPAVLRRELEGLLRQASAVATLDGDAPPLAAGQALGFLSRTGWLSRPLVNASRASLRALGHKSHPEMSLAEVTATVSAVRKELAFVPPPVASTNRGVEGRSPADYDTSGGGPDSGVGSDLGQQRDSSNLEDGILRLDASLAALTSRLDELLTCKFKELQATLDGKLGSLEGQLMRLEHHDRGAPGG